MRDENGNVVLAIVLFRDITEIRRLEQQREEYLALTSHDLRNPLNVILMSASLLRGSMAEKGLAADLLRAGLVERNAKRMTAMLEALTEATSLELRGVELRHAECDLQGLVAGVVDCMDAPRAERITIETDGSPPYVVLADAPRLERVVTNLLTNALKYSAEDAPVIARFARKGSSVELDVIDRGIGIAPESVKMLFDRYYRTTAGKARASGLGLGLYIARLIVEAHGGRIDVSSVVGEGSTFRLILPSHAAAACFRASGEKASPRESPSMRRCQSSSERFPDPARRRDPFGAAPEKETKFLRFAPQRHERFARCHVSGGGRYDKARWARFVHWSETMRVLIDAGPTNMKVATRHSFVSVDGMRLHWAELGEASERVPVVLLHGLNDSYLSWKRVAPALAVDRRVLMPDLPGYGLSDRPNASYALQWHAQVMARWLGGIAFSSQKAARTLPHGLIRGDQNATSTSSRPGADGED